MENLVIILILAVILGLAARYVYKAKKSGRKCIGCPSGGCNCQSNSTKPGQCCCGCGHSQQGKD
ncbi:MAG: FeoB-associated Cys-rich membrane protein [Oscillospiraceae bacterium]|nr:FeoB-associated Cys-rich membrane protein [Oscillospiraceae bacterium]